MGEFLKHANNMLKSKKKWLSNKEKKKNSKKNLISWMPKQTEKAGIMKSKKKKKNKKSKF